MSLFPNEDAMPYVYTTGIQSRLIDHYGNLIDASFQTIQDSPELVKAADQR
jgi:hypothetical protein